MNVERAMSKARKLDGWFEVEPGRGRKCGLMPGAKRAAQRQANRLRRDLARALIATAVEEMEQERQEAEQAAWEEEERMRALYDDAWYWA